MRTKKKTYNYDSSAYGDEDYGQEDYEGEEDDIEEEDQYDDESDFVSDYDSAGNGNGKKNHQNSTAQRQKGNNHKGRSAKDYEDEMEDSYEDEDPFSPEIEQILADKQVEIAQVAPQQTQSQGRSQRNNVVTQQSKVQNWYLIKFVDQSYLHVKWMEESELEEYSYRAKQKIRRYQNQKEKKRLLQEQLSRQVINFKPQKNHHFSDDDEEEEEDEDAAIKGIPLPVLPMVSDEFTEGAEQPKPGFIKVEGPNGEDLTQYFDKAYVAVERVLSTTLIFPVIHPRQAKQIRGKWQEDCLKVVNVIINFRKNNVPIGLAFAEQLDQDNEELQDYFKVVKQPIDLIMIMNRLFNKMYQQPQDFWNDLGLVFKNCRSYYKSQKKGLRKQCDSLRVLAYHLYNDWYNEMKTRFKTGIAIPVQPQQDQITKTEAPNNQQKLSNQAPAEKDTTIVNLQSLLKSQQNALDIKKKQSSESQQVQVQQNQQIQQQTPQQQMPPPQVMNQQQQMPNMLHQNQQGIMPPQFQNPNMNQNPMMVQNQQQPQDNEMWNMMQQQQRNPQQNQFQISGQNNQQQQFQPNPFQQPSNFTPSLPSFNSIMNPMMQQQQPQFQDPMHMQQQMNMMQQAPMMAQQQFMNPQQQQFDMIQQMNANQMDWMQNNINKDMMMKQFMGLSGLAPQPIMDTQNTSRMGLHLPTMGQIQQNLMQNPLMNQLAKPPNQFDPNNAQSILELQQLQALQQQQDKNLNYMSQMLGLQGQTPFGMDNLMGQNHQDFSLGMRQNAQGAPQLPSFNQLNLGQVGQGGFQLPSLSSLGQIGSQMSTFDSYQNQMMNLMQNPQQQQFMNPMQQQQQNMFKQLPSFHNAIMNPNAYDEMSMMLNNLGANMMGPGPSPGLPGMNGFNPFGQQMPPDQFGGLQFSGMQQQQTMFGPNGQPIPQQVLGHQMNPMFNQQPKIMHHQHQPSRVIDPNLIQPDNLDAYNDKQQDPPVPPCIMDPGEYYLSWLLEDGETQQDISQSQYLTMQEIEIAIKNKHFVDQLYLVKWKSLSYSQSTWEPESSIKVIFEEKINDYNRYNRSLDQSQREKLDQLIKNHKKMLRYTEKKFTTQGKRIDPQQENYLSLQEAKINRQLLNEKIQQIMGEAFYHVIQYSEKQGIVPTFKKPTQRLKDYQVIGLNWLIRAWHEHRNVVLADEMGLGKTIMTLSLFDHLNKAYKLRGPYLILAPLTTLEHWKRIADEWTTLNSILYYDPGSAEGRNEIRHWEWFYTDVTFKGTITQKSELYKFNLIITSFEVFMQDLNPILQEIPFIYIVVDEAHRLKNKQAKTLKLLKDHPCKRILLLTGTPVQNNTKELWTLLNYIEPEKFNSLDQFLEQYGNLESYEQIQKLHTILKPHFLRRLKEEVDNSIPPLQETVIEVGLTTLQNTYYKGIYGENRMVLAKFGTNSIKTSQLNNMDVQLRKCCNHLFLLKGVEEELTRDCRNEEDLYKKLLESSGKLMLLDKFIEKFKEENHKMLIFSQFKRMLDIIELYLRMKRVPYEKLTGSVKTADRISAIQRFNDDKTFGVFLLTTRAGGLGINLTSARVVIIFDSDWNPQNDLQAIARAHRIGQKFEVQVYRLITSKTYEEQMFERASKKLGMEQALFSKGAFHQNDDIEVTGLHLRGLTELKQDSKEIENLLKYGAYAFIDNEGEDDQINFNKDIDEILATGKKKEFTYSKGLYTLQKSTFNASKYEKLPNVDDPDFWNKVMPFDSIISITVLEKRFKKEKKEMGKNDKVQKEFFKDLEIVFNDFMDAKFDQKTSQASKKTLEADEEKLREILKKMIRLTGMKLMYVEKCKEWLRDMLRTNKRKKPEIKFHQEEEGGDEDEIEVELQNEEDDIIMDDSDDNMHNRNLRQREPRKQPKAEPVPSDPTQGPKKRGRKPKAQLIKKEEEVEEEQDALEDEGLLEEEYDDEDEPYDDEEDKDYYEGRPMNNQTNLGKRQQPVQEYESDDDGGLESRYGLRGRPKRQKTDRNGEYSSSANFQSQPQYTPSQLRAMSKMNDQLAKRNEKNGIVCGYCMQPETIQSLCSFFCSGYCQRFFHEECKDKMFPNPTAVAKQSRNVNGQWQCDDCLNSVAQCFCCKQKGQILLFPKKGKPKAAGLIDQQLVNSCSMIMEDEQDAEEDDQNPDEDFDEDELAEENDDNQEEQKEELVKVEEQAEHQETQEVPNEVQGDLEAPKLEKDSSKIVINIGQAEESNTKIVLTNLFTKQATSPKTQDLNSSPDKSEQKESMQQNGQIDESEANDDKYVVRCTLGGCFKYYHVNCVYKNANVSCINSMKVQRFRCPLHYCAICRVSGDSVLIVQCVNCPTSYHLKCLPQDAKAIRLTKKYIICGEHNMSADDFPKYEEKSSVGAYQKQLAIQGSAQSLNEKQKTRKKKQKKRGRKPRMNQSSAGVYEDEIGDLIDKEYNSPLAKNGQQKTSAPQNSAQTSFKIKLGGNISQQEPSIPSESHQSLTKQPSNKANKLMNQQSILQQHNSSSSSLRGDMPRPLFTVEKTKKQEQKVYQDQFQS